jgi:hypothetical protein
MWAHIGRMMAVAAIVHLSSITFYLAFYLGHTPQPMSDHKPTTYPIKYLRQYLADEDVLSHHALRMHGGQTPVPNGCPYLLSWGRRFMVKQQKHKKTITLYANKSVETL